MKQIYKNIAKSRGRGSSSHSRRKGQSLDDEDSAREKCAEIEAGLALQRQECSRAEADEKAESNIKASADAKAEAKSKGDDDDDDDIYAAGPKRRLVLPSVGSYEDKKASTHVLPLSPVLNIVRMLRDRASFGDPSTPWLYGAYGSTHPQFAEFPPTMGNVFEADYHPLSGWLICGSSGLSVPNDYALSFDSLPHLSHPPFPVDGTVRWSPSHPISVCSSLNKVILVSMGKPVQIVDKISSLAFDGVVEFAPTNELTLYAAIGGRIQVVPIDAHLPLSPRSTYNANNYKHDKQSSSTSTIKTLAPLSRSQPDVIVAGTRSGKITLFDIRQAPMTTMNVGYCPFCAHHVWPRDENSVVSSDITGNIQLWDMRMTGELYEQSRPPLVWVHKSPLFSTSPSVRKSALVSNSSSELKLGRFWLTPERRSVVTVSTDSTHLKVYDLSKAETSIGDIHPFKPARDGEGRFAPLTPSSARVAKISRNSHASDFGSTYASSSPHSILRSPSSSSTTDSLHSHRYGYGRDLEDDSMVSGSTFSSASDLSHSGSVWEGLGCIVQTRKESGLTTTLFDAVN